MSTELLPGSQLDVQIAEALGATWQHHDGYREGVELLAFDHGDKGGFAHSRRIVASREDGVVSPWAALLSYSTDRSAAHDVLQHLVEQGLAVQISIDPTVGEQPHVLIAVFDELTKLSEATAEGPLSEAFALALARAVLQPELLGFLQAATTSTEVPS